MPIFSFESGTAKRIGQKEFANEKELHELIDRNLEEIFNLRYIKDEHITDKHGRIETLAIDEGNRPVVIEYKKIKDYGQLTQANRYITWVRQNPDSFELLVLQRYKSSSESMRPVDDTPVNNVFSGGYRHGRQNDYENQTGIDSIPAPVR